MDIDRLAPLSDAKHTATYNGPGDSHEDALAGERGARCPDCRWSRNGSGFEAGAGASLHQGANDGAGLSDSLHTLSGWLVGGGWSIRAEYDYFGLSNQTFTVPAASPILAGDTFTNGSNNIQMATIGINYRFGAGY